MHITKQIKQYIIDQMDHYIADVHIDIEENLNDGYYSAAGVLRDNIAIAQTALNNFKQDSNWENFHNTISLQSTSSLEECLYYLTSGNREVGLYFNEIC